MMLISSRPCSVGKFVVSRAVEAYDLQARSRNRKLRFSACIAGLPMSPDRKAKLTLSLALGLLCLSGIAAGITIARLYINEKWVRHTYDVEVAVGDVESALADVGRHRIAYIDSGTASALQGFKSTQNRVPTALSRVHQLLSDNSSQLALLDRLQSNANERVAIFAKSVELKQLNGSDPANQVALTSQMARFSFETAEITEHMRRNEDALLEQRAHLSSLLFTITLGILVASYASSAVMFWFHYRLLHRELQKRGSAERQLRYLSGRLMHLQDEERRRFARELHDGLGQNLVVAKMTSDALLAMNPSDPRYAEMGALLEECVSQTRTISYLLHPPFLDEVGFVSAAKWLIKGYSKRTGIDVSVDISEQVKRLPRHLELTLFRILQETLTNIHRHAKSARAQVSVQVKSQEVFLVVKDFGKGIPRDTLADFEANGTHVGVGLAGMKERAREFGGKWDLKSGDGGTEITVKMPLTADDDVAPAQSDSFS